MRHPGIWRLSTVIALVAASASSAVAQQTEPPTREAAIEQDQAEKAKTLHPYVPGKTEELLNRARRPPGQRRPRWHPFFESAYSGGGFTLGAGYAHHVSAYNMLDVRGSYTITDYKRVEAEFIAPRLFNRRGRLVGPRRLARGDPGRLLRHRDERHRWTTARTTVFKQPYGSATLDVLADATLLMLGAGSSCPSGRSGPARGRSPRSRPSTRRRRCRALGPRSRICTRRAPSASTGAPRPATRGAAASTASRCTTTPTTTSEFGFQQVDYEAIQHIPILREAWVISLRGLAADRVQQGRSADPVLHAAVGRRRIHRCAASAAGASAIRTACCFRRSGASWSTASSTRPFFYDAGQGRRAHGGSRPQRPEERLRLRRPLPRTVRHAAAHRAGEEQRRHSASSSRSSAVF